MKRVVIGFSIALLFLCSVAHAQNGWAEYVNDIYGFRIKYPIDLLHVDKASEAGDGQAFVSEDGRARLVVGVLKANPAQSLASYQERLIRESYAGRRISYNPVGSNWFVLSGEHGENIFYEKVMRSCAGGLISSFAIVYPISHREAFDRAVEGLQRSFTPGPYCPPPDRADVSPRQMPSMRSPLADRIARERGQDVIVVLRRTSPPYDRKYIRGYVGP